MIRDFVDARSTYHDIEILHVWRGEGGHQLVATDTVTGEQVEGNVASYATLAEIEIVGSKFIAATDYWSGVIPTETILLVTPLENRMRLEPA